MVLRIGQIKTTPTTVLGGPATAGVTQSVNITITGTGVNNVTLRQMQLNANVQIESAYQGAVSMPLVSYLLNGWQYIEVSFFGGPQWMKSKIDMSSYNALDYVQRAVELGQSASSATLSGTEDVDGVSCIADRPSACGIIQMAIFRFST
jgi:hypothetical protein